MNLNKVQLIGRVTANPELRNTPGGQAVSTFGVATNRTWTGKTGERQEQVEFHNVVVWGRQAEIASQFLVKGQLVYVEGRLQTRQWQDKQGANHKTTEVICERFQLGPKAFSAGSGQATGSPQAAPAASAQAKSFSPAPEEKPQAPAAEEIPTIDMDAEDIKPEDLPF